MTLDVQAAVASLFAADVKTVVVKDFHRTAYNILPEWIDSRAKVVSGYKIGPIAGIGNPSPAQAVLFLGMHAASGSGGFLAHTFTSRIQRLEVNGRLMPEVALFSGVLAPFGIRPIFASGCPIACAQAKEAIAGIDTYVIDKMDDQNRFDAKRWRRGLGQAVAGALKNGNTLPYQPAGPFDVKMTLRDGESAAHKLANRWQLDYDRATILFRAESFDELYLQLIRLCYLTPWLERIQPLALAAYNFKGRIGLQWVRKTLLIAKAPRIRK
jgi:D-amino peptidase